MLLSGSSAHVPLGQVKKQDSSKLSVTTPICGGKPSHHHIRRTQSVFSCQCGDTHPALFAVGQQLVLLLGVEDERVRGEGDGLALVGGAFVSADEEHLVPLVYGGAHQHHLAREERGGRGLRSEVKRLMPRTRMHSSVSSLQGARQCSPWSIPAHTICGAQTNKIKSIAKRGTASPTDSFKEGLQAATTFHIKFLCSLKEPLH